MIPRPLPNLETHQVVEAGSNPETRPTTTPRRNEMKCSCGREMATYFCSICDRTPEQPRDDLRPLRIRRAMEEIDRIGFMGWLWSQVEPHRTQTDQNNP